MPNNPINADRIRRLAPTLTDADVALPSNAIAFRGDAPGFKAILLGTLEQAHDYDRELRLQPLVRQLNEPERLWLCENHADLTSQK